MAHSALRPQDRLRGLEVPPPEAPPAVGDRLLVSAVFILGHGLPDSAEPRRGLPWGFLPPDGGGKPALPLWAPPGSEGSRGLPTPGAQRAVGPA